ncbi:MAG: hypothetical protein LBQ75_06640 [Zoogloeaceae bacterium]|nr:hypothetical protein [Zoogloeaceae bacterium]
MRCPTLLILLAAVFVSVNVMAEPRRSSSSSATRYSQQSPRHAPAARHAPNAYYAPGAYYGPYATVYGMPFFYPYYPAHPQVVNSPYTIFLQQLEVANNPGAYYPPPVHSPYSVPPGAAPYAVPERNVEEGDVEERE